MPQLTRMEAIAKLRQLKKIGWCKISREAENALCDTPEGCKLVAHNTGDGWQLSVQDQNGDTVAILEWPESWPEIMNADQIREAGFRID